MICPVCNENIKRIPSHFKNANDKSHKNYLKFQYELGKKYLFQGMTITQIRNVNEIVLKRMVECYLYENFKNKIRENAKINRSKNISKANSKENSFRKIRKKQLEEIIENGIDGIDYVTCKICGYKNTNISTHVTRFHKISAKEYREKYGEDEKLFCKKVRDKFSERMKENNPNNNPESIKKMKITKSKSKLKRSEKNKEDFASGKRKIPETNGRGNSGKRGDLNNQYFRSNWEANVARILKLKNIEYKYEKMKIKLYDNNGKLKFTYVVDFYLPKYDKYIEVKGKWEKIAKEKIDMFIKKYGKRKIIIIDGNKYKKLERWFSHKIPLWENDKKNIKKTPELYKTKNKKEVINNFEKCLVCGQYFNDWIKHLIHIKDDKHIAFKEQQISIIKNLFYNYDVNRNTDLTKFGVYFKYKQCLRIWEKYFTKEERKKRADILSSLGNIRTKNKNK